MPDLSWDDYAQVLDSAKSITHLRQIVRLILRSPQFTHERALANDGKLRISGRSLHGKLLLRLLGDLDECHSAVPQPASLHLDATCKYLIRALRQSISIESFTFGFLRELAKRAGTSYQPETLLEIHSVFQDLLSTPKWRSRFESHQQSSSASAKGKERASDLEHSTLTHIHETRVKAAFQTLMSAFSKLGRQDKVYDLHMQSVELGLPATPWQYQLALVAILDRLLYGVRDSKGRRISPGYDPQTSSQQLMAHVGALRRQMELQGVKMDDMFLSTVVAAIGAPLRSPLRQSLSDAHLAQVKEMHTWVLDAFLQHTDKKLLSADGSCPSKLLAALIQVELDAVKALGSPEDRNTFKRLQSLVAILATRHPSGSRTDAPLATADSPALPAVSPPPDNVVHALYVHTRVLAAKKDLNGALQALSDLLSTEPEPEADVSAMDSHVVRDGIHKRRGAVILLFSAAIGPRSENWRRDYALEVLETVAKHERFAQTWGTRVERSRYDPDLDLGQLDPVHTLARLWKRYMRAWWRDVSYGRKPRGSFAATNPWPTLSRALDAMLLMVERLPVQAITATRRAKSRHTLYTARDQTERDPLASLFNERNTVASMVHYALAGGRKAGEAPDTAAQRLVGRMDKLLRVFAAVGVQERTWEFIAQTLVRKAHRSDRIQLAPATLAELVRKVDDYRQQHGSG